MKFEKIGIVFNPVGGSAKSGVVDQLIIALEQAFPGVVVLRAATGPEPGSATVLASNLAVQKVDLVIAIGGDGTVCQVAEGLIGTGIPMTTFPGGTGNLFARTFFAIPTVDEFVHMIGCGEPQAIDMIQLSYQDQKGTAHQRLFLVGTGMGKVSDAISEASPTFKKIFGKLAYVWRVGRASLLPGGQSFTIKARGQETTQQAAAVFVLNVTPPTMSMLSRGCNASDGLADVCIMKATNFWHMIKIAFCLAFGKPESSRRYSTMRTSELTITSADPVNPNIDGDPSHLTNEVHMKVLQGKVKMILAS